ncbi:MAG: division/cell wall cluster transcriptional repressor MraZ [Candidatus Glassbacteria bacterium RBG_16_58_8]|uniref:Transcriptional regulator MraZ n=1 Tax=Candidatus Glassbacteria bacterium RBG_16_58_8 TaxID=1817866 RepID=A0A1F5YBF9_9BACT|nr:MAG: division/cell wall cluster transcriptional repressor MraZ [Candidatus Glassbacteria bacterium RBG_16_58_8]
MAIYHGKFIHAIDHKGRISLPARFRKDGKTKKFMLFRGMENCLLLFTAPDWDRMVSERSDLLTIESEAHRNYQHFLGAYTSEVELDGQGRITIPPHLLEAGGLKREAVIVGAIKWIEIWDPEEHQRFEEEVSFKEVAEKVFRTVQEMRKERG